MSGGSYCYLMLAEDVIDLAGKRVQLEEMHDRLAGLGYAPKATAATARLLNILRQIDNELPENPVRDVWKAVEWRDSSDWGEDQMREVIEQYEGTFHPAPEPAVSVGRQFEDWLRAHGINPEDMPRSAEVVVYPNWLKTRVYSKLPNGQPEIHLLEIATRWKTVPLVEPFPRDIATLPGTTITFEDVDPQEVSR